MHLDFALLLSQDTSTHSYLRNAIFPSIVPQGCDSSYCTLECLHPNVGKLLAFEFELSHC